jgi:dTDP-4-amino-4,6-dideoxygalactose transaminase
MRSENAQTYLHMLAEKCLIKRELVIPPRDALREFLKERGVATEIYYPVPLHLQPCYRDLKYKSGDLPESERAAKETLALPIYPELTREQQQYVVDQIAIFFDGE